MHFHTVNKIPTNASKIPIGAFFLPHPVLAHYLTPTCFGASEAPSSGSQGLACRIFDPLGNNLAGSYWTFQV
jgi:hypothetical protein